MRLPKTPEEKVAEQIQKLVSDVNLDLDRVGINLARLPSNLTYNRIMLIAESAEWEKEVQNGKQQYTLFD